MRPYQQTRYWSNVPFRMVTTDAVKYSAIPSPDNPGQPVGTRPDVLRDELVRHLTEDEPDELVRLRAAAARCRSR